ncbi:hypothetical protein SVAN01_03084 [Stagonosporopsis vannaccii]|nr:hypothetical protein SVAN01_03084 [Stagonosporopsis vannaccii]
MCAPADNEVSGIDAQSRAGQKTEAQKRDASGEGVERETHKTRSLLPGTYQTITKRRRKVCDDSRAGLNRAADLCLVRVRDTLAAEGSSRGGSSLQAELLLARAGCYNCVLPAAAGSQSDHALILACGAVLVDTTTVAAPSAVLAIARQPRLRTDLPLCAVQAAVHCCALPRFLPTLLHRISACLDADLAIKHPQTLVDPAPPLSERPIHLSPALSRHRFDSPTLLCTPKSDAVEVDSRQRKASHSVDSVRLPLAHPSKSFAAALSFSAFLCVQHSTVDCEAMLLVNSGASFGPASQRSTWG